MLLCLPWILLCLEPKFQATTTKLDFSRKKKELFLVEYPPQGCRPWPQRDQLTVDHSDSPGPRLYLCQSIPSTPTPRPHVSDLPTVPTGNTFLCNLPWQGENVSIKRRLPWQTGRPRDELSDWAVPPSAQLVLISFHFPRCSSFFLTFFHLGRPPPPPAPTSLPESFLIDCCGSALKNPASPRLYVLPWAILCLCFALQRGYMDMVSLDLCT